MDRREGKISKSMRWKVAAGIGLTGILLLFITFDKIGDGSFIFGPALLWAALYGWISRDLKLSAFFGVLFFLALPCVLFLRYHEVAPPSVLPFFLLWGLVTPLMGVIWAWVGRKMPSEWTYSVHHCCGHNWITEGIPKKMRLWAEFLH